MASLREIATRAGVSVATVSRALNDTGTVSPRLRSRVLKEAMEVGHVRAVDPASATGRIGLAYAGSPVTPAFGNFEAAVIAGVNRAAFEQRWDTAIIDIVGDKREREPYAALMKRKGVDGLILRTNTEKRHVCERIAAEGCPAVVLSDRFDDPRVSFVTYNSRRTAERAVEHLIHLGHRRIALCLHAVPDADHTDRHDAWRDVLARHDLPVEPEYLVQVFADADGGASAISRLMSLPSPPTAVMFTDPPATVGGLRRAHELGVRIPEDLSIVGFDDAQLRKLTHPIYTAICQDAESLAYTATQWLINRTRRPADQPATLRQVREAYFEVNGTTSIAPTTAIRVSPDGRRIQTA